MKAFIVVMSIFLLAGMAQAHKVNKVWNYGHEYSWGGGAPARSLWNVKETVQEVRESQRSTIFDTPDIWRWKKTWKRQYRGVTYHYGFFSPFPYNRPYF